MSRLLFRGLVAVDGDRLEGRLDLAERLEVSPDGTVFRATLRPDSTFADGTAITAGDVVATFESTQDAGLHSRFRETYARVTRVVAETDRRVRFELSSPHAPFFTDLELPIVRRRDAARRMSMEDGASWSGSGAFVLESADDRHVALVRRSDGRRVVLRVVRDESTRVLRLLGDGGDAALGNVSAQNLELFENDPRFHVLEAEGSGTVYLGTRTDAPALRDVRVRRAISLAIDRDALVAAKYRGRATPAIDWIPDGHWAAGVRTGTLVEADGRPRFAPEEAARLIDEAGARGTVLVLRASEDHLRVSTARAIARSLAPLGLDVRVRASDTATLLSDLDRGRFDLALLAVPELVEPHVLWWFFASENVPQPGRAGGANRWRFRDPVADALIERGRTATTRDARATVYEELSARLREQLPVIPLLHERSIAVVRRDVTRLRPTRDGRYGTLVDADRT